MRISLGSSRRNYRNSPVPESARWRSLLSIDDPDIASSVISFRAALEHVQETVDRQEHDEYQERRQARDHQQHQDWYADDQKKGQDRQAYSPIGLTTGDLEGLSHTIASEIHEADAWATESTGACLWSISLICFTHPQIIPIP